GPVPLSPADSTVLGLPPVADRGGAQPAPLQRHRPLRPPGLGRDRLPPPAAITVPSAKHSTTMESPPSRHSRYLPPAPDFATQNRARATITDCGPAPAGPAASTAVPSAAKVPAHVPSCRRVRANCAPGGSSLSPSPFFGRASAARCCSSTSLAAHWAQRVRWNFASRCARYLSTA